MFVVLNIIFIGTGPNTGHGPNTLHLFGKKKKKKKKKINNLWEILSLFVLN